MVPGIQLNAHHPGHRAGHVHGFLGDLQRIGGKCIPLHPLNIPVYPAGQAQNQRYTNNSNRAGKGCQKRAALFTVNNQLTRVFPSKESVMGSLPALANVTVPSLLSVKLKTTVSVCSVCWPSSPVIFFVTVAVYTV